MLKLAISVFVLQEVDNELFIAIRGLHMDLGYLVVKVALKQFGRAVFVFVCGFFHLLHSVVLIVHVQKLDGCLEKGVGRGCAQDGLLLGLPVWEDGVQGDIADPRICRLQP